jgi:hypothetical protein
MKNAIFFLLLSIALTTCTKEKGKLPEPYVKRIIYSETFDTNPNWTPLPSGTIFNPDTNVVRVQNGLLKLTYDQTLIGCAWIGAQYRQTQPLENSFLDKVGIRVKLNNGFFQYIETYHDTVDALGHPCQSGTIPSFSDLRLDFNCLDIWFPNPNNGRFHRDSVIDYNIANKVTGKEFEIIYDKGKKQCFIDGIEQATDIVYFNWQNIANQPLNIEFDLGHLSFLNPRVDELFVDEIEIYTWTGEKK